MALQVLIVDDSKVMRTMVRRVLNMSGLPVAGVHEAADGDEALRMAGEHAFDLFVVDVNMPGLDGVGLLGELRKREGTVRTPVVVISAGISAARMELTHALHAHFVRKPFSAEVLSETLRLAVGAPDDALSKLLTDATISALEQLCFAVPQGLAFDGALLDCSAFPGAVVQFEGLAPGALALWVQPDALALLASNMLGSEEPPSWLDAMDALREIARVLCARVHTQRFGEDAVEELGLPRAFAAGEAVLDAALRETARVQLHVDGGAVVVAAYARPLR